MNFELKSIYFIRYVKLRVMVNDGNTGTGIPIVPVYTGVPVNHIFFLNGIPNILSIPNRTYQMI